MYKRPTLRKRFTGTVVTNEELPLDPTTRLGKLCSMIQRPDPDLKPLKFVPIGNVENYISALKLNGRESEVDEVRKKHTRAEKTKKTTEERWKLPIQFSDQVLVNLSVKNGKVKVKLNCPFDEYWSYQRDGKLVPIEVRIRCMKRAGAPHSILLNMLEKHNKYFTKSNLEKEQLKVDKAFMKFNVKPKTKILKPVKKKIC